MGKTPGIRSTASGVVAGALLAVAGCGTQAPIPVDLTGTWRVTFPDGTIAASPCLTFVGTRFVAWDVDCSGAFLDVVASSPIAYGPGVATVGVTLVGTNGQPFDVSLVVGLASSAPLNGEVGFVFDPAADPLPPLPVELARYP